MSDEILDDIDFDEDISDEEMESYLHFFIKKRSDNYIEHWKNSKIISFDFLKMMIGIPWLLYRRMNLWAVLLIIFVGLICGLKQIFLIIPIYGFAYLIVEYESLDLLRLILYSSASIIVAIVCGFFNKSIYLNFAKKEILGRHHMIIRYNKTLGRSRREVAEIDVEDMDMLETSVEGIGGVNKEIPTAVLLILLFYLLSRVSTGMNTILTF